VRFFYIIMTTVLKLKLGNFKKIVISKAFSDLGGYLNLIAFSGYIYHLTNSSIYISLFLTSRIIGSMVGSISSSYLYRHNKKYILASADIARAFTLFIFILIPIVLRAEFIIIFAFVLGWGQSIYNVGLNSQIPSLVSEDKIVSTNAVLVFVSSFSVIISGLIMGGSLIYFNYDFIFVILIVFYTASSVFLISLKLKENVRSAKKHSPSFMKILSEIKNHKTILMFSVLTLFDAFGSSSHNVGFPILAKVISDTHANVFLGLLISSWALGKLLGSALSRNIILKKIKTLNAMENLAFLSVIIMSVFFILAFNSSWLFWVMLFLLMAGLGDGMAEVSIVCRLQKTPEYIRVSAFSMFFFAQMSGFTVGLLLVGLLLKIIPLNITIITFHIIPILLVLLIYHTRYKLVRRRILLRK